MNTEILPVIASVITANVVVVMIVSLDDYSDERVCVISFISSAKEVADLRTEMKGKDKVQVEELENHLLKQKDLRTAHKGQQN